MPNDHGDQNAPPGFWSTRYGIGCLVIGAGAAYFLLTEHLAHTISALPYLLLLACPLMHVFMHGGHNKAESDESKTNAPRTGGQP